MNFNNQIESPLEITVSFCKLISKYESLKDSHNPIIANTARTLLEHVEKFPDLKENFNSFEQIEKYNKQICFLLQDLFHPALSGNEIKAAGIPFNNHVFMKTERFKQIIESQGEDYELEVKNLNSEYWYIIASSIILKACYGYDLNFKRPFYYEIPDERGIMRYYKILFNADFIDVIPKPNTPKITQEDYELLLDNFENAELWKEKFPPNSYEFKGFIISNIFDVTDDQSISNIKTALIGEEKNKGKKDVEDLNSIFRSLLGLEDIKVGFTKYVEEQDTFEKLLGNTMDSYLVNDRKIVHSENTLCSWSYKRLLKDKKFLSISDVDKHYNPSGKNAPHIEQLHRQNIKSAIFAPVANEDDIIGLLEIVSDKRHLLNSINAQKLVDIMPFLISSVERYKNEELNLIEAIIQKECTSIHPSVHWRFVEEAYKYIESDLSGKEPVFNSIGFDNIYPLYGQIDIKGSSDARNTATINDLNLQLQQLRHLFRMALETYSLPIYDKFLFQINEYISSLNEFFQVDSEQQISRYIKREIHPVLKHLKQNKAFAEDVDYYFESLDSKTNSFYKYRKDYDETIALINKCMSTLLDDKQNDAQAMYPHYYERFKTDGVEHNMYIGESITKHDTFNPIYLYNLRLWQLQVMCEMENEYYQMQSKFKVKLDVASMILVFNQPLSISFRMDEKQFDVDGTYNARYEIVKKRVDKAHIKGTNERITQKGKISIIYSQKQDEEEYLNYVKFLQSKKYLDTDIEILELQDLQAVSGLKAIRVSILYHKDKEDKAFYTYEDLMKEIA